MYTESDQWLELAAKCSIIGSVLVIIYFFVLTSWRIARLPNSPWRWGTAVHYQKEIHQRPTKMPFLFKLKDEAVIDRISFQLECLENPSCIRVLWAVDATYLFKLINAPSWNLIQDLDNSLGATERANANAADSYDGFYAFIDTLSVPPTSVDNQPEKGLTVAVPRDFDWSVLVNQYKYPAAIFFMKGSGSESEEDSESRIVGLCVILHVNNTLIQKPTAVLAQYIKLANGQAHKLESLFVMDNDEKMDAQTNTSSNFTDTESQQSPREEEPFDDVLCSVCQALPVSRAIIPCRHVCLCAICFSKVKICPICRGPISYFFKTRCENYVKSTNIPTEEIRPSSWEETINNWSDGLNTALGYRE